MDLKELNTLQIESEALISEHNRLVAYADKIKVNRDKWSTEDFPHEPPSNYTPVPYINFMREHYSTSFNETVAPVVQDLLKLYGPIILRLAELQLRNKAKKLKLQSDLIQDTIKISIL